MTNWDTAAALEYHDSTKHEPGAPTDTQVDAAIIPRKFKLYRDLEPIALPAPAPSTLPGLDVLTASTPVSAGAALDLPRLAALLHFSAGIIRRTTVRGQTIEFRAASCTGALYHVELYVICCDLPGLEAGVYHFGVHDGALRRLRAGDFRAALSAAVADAPVVLALTSTFWRNSWRYGERAYRHAFWDGATIVANLLSLARDLGLPASLVTGFVDGELNRLLDVDGRREAAIALVPVGSGAPSGLTPLSPRLDLATVPLSRVEIEYPAIDRLHAASALADANELLRFQRGVEPPAEGAVGEAVALPAATAAGAEPLQAIIARRGSARRFAQVPIAATDLAALLAAAHTSIERDYAAIGADLNDAYLIINAVEGLTPGAYVYHPGTRSLDLLRRGDFREAAGHLGLDQPLAADAAVNVYYLTDLEAVLAALGNRGYRAAQLEAGVRGGELYLAAHALDLAATGLTFYDDEVTRFFEPHARGKSVMFLTAIGRRH